MKRTPLYITVRPNNTTVIESHPEGFPVDGDSLHNCTTLRKRAEAVIAADAELLTAAREWLGAPLHPGDVPLEPAQVTQLISKLFTGGAPRFVAMAPSLKKILVAA